MHYSGLGRGGFTVGFEAAMLIILLQCKTVPLHDKRLKIGVRKCKRVAPKETQEPPKANYKFFTPQTWKDYFLLRWRQQAIRTHRSCQCRQNAMLKHMCAFLQSLVDKHCLCWLVAFCVAWRVRRELRLYQISHITAQMGVRAVFYICLYYHSPLPVLNLNCLSAFQASTFVQQRPLTWAAPAAICAPNKHTSCWTKALLAYCATQ